MSTEKDIENFKLNENLENEQEVDNITLSQSSTDSGICDIQSPNVIKQKKECKNKYR